MFKPITLFHLFGFKIKADGSWIFISVLLAWTLMNSYMSLLPGLGPNTYQFMSIFTVAGIIISIVAHELGHAIIAEYYDMPVEGIRFFIFGGVTEMKAEPSHPKGEFLMAIAGPAASVLMGLFFWGLADLYKTLISFSSPWAKTLDVLGSLNMMLAAFNIIPAFPLDGGRALRAIVWKKRNNLVLATRIASDWGATFSYCLMALACYNIVVENDFVNGMWVGLFGFFMLSGGNYAVKDMESRSLLAQETVARFMQNQVSTVPPDLVINDLVDRYISQHYQKVFPVIEKGLLIGAITLPAVLALDRHKWHWLYVSSVMEPLNAQNLVTPESSAADALDTMQKNGKELLLVAKDGKFLGVIMFRDLANYLAVIMKLDHNKPVEKSRTAF